MAGEGRRPSFVLLHDLFRTLAAALLVGVATQQSFSTESEDPADDGEPSVMTDWRDLFTKPELIGMAIKEPLEYDLGPRELLVEFFPTATIDAVQPYLEHEQLLQQAVRYGTDPDVIAFLIESGFDPKRAYGPGIQEYPQDFGEPLQQGPLHFAAGYHPDARVIDLLVEAGADVHAIAGWGLQTPLQLAAWRNNAAVVSALLAHGARVGDVNGRISPIFQRGSGINGNTALHLAARNADAAVIDVLVDAGAKVERRNSGGVAALHFAAMEQNAAAIKALVRRGADPAARVDVAKREEQTHDCTGCDAIHVLVDSLGWPEEVGDLERVEEVLRTLLTAGLDINAAVGPGMYEGRGSLHMAIESELDSAVVEMLIRHGAKADALALHVAFASTHQYSGMYAGANDDRAIGSANNIRVLELLLGAGLGADAINTTDACGRTVLHRAVSFAYLSAGVPKAVKLLIDAGGDANAGNPHENAQKLLACDVRGFTPLHEAVRWGGESDTGFAIASILLEAGADRTVRDWYGRTPADVADGERMRRLLTE